MWWSRWSWQPSFFNVCHRGGSSEGHRRLEARADYGHSVTRVHLALDPTADALLATDPLALLIGMVLDQQIPMERAFAAPAALRERLGRDLDPHDIAAMDPDALAAVFAQAPALHRFPSSMARRVHELCRLIVDDYGGQTQRIWLEAPSGADLVRRLRALPGLGEQKARIFAALLAKQFGVRPPGWEAATAPFGEPGVFRSVADIVDDASLAAVRETKARAKATALSHSRPQRTAGEAPASKATVAPTGRRRAP